MEECHGLLSSADSQAEKTVLNLLVRNWRIIANQVDRYKELAQIRRVKK
jgi:hypothetical protein